MSRTTKVQSNAKLMVEAFRKRGAVARATNAEVRDAMHALAAMGDQDGVSVLIAEEARRADAKKALLAALGG